MIISIANLKGGALRTTTSILLAETFRRHGRPVVVADTTPQGDALKWASYAATKERPLDFEVRALRQDSSIQDLRERSKAFRTSLKALEDSLGKEGVVVVDTDSRDPRILHILNGVIDASVVPFELSFLSLNPTLETLKIINVEYVMFAHHRYDEINDEDKALLARIAVNRNALCSEFFGYEAKCVQLDFPSEMPAFEQLMKDIEALKLDV